MTNLPTEALKLDAAKRRAVDYLELTKPRILPMVLVVTAAGFYLASGAVLEIFLLIHTLIGSALATGGALALNQASEEDLDARMIRTQKRPLPDGRLLKLDALLFGSAIMLLGVAYLAVFVNPFTALLIVATGGIYLFLYTPLKRTTSLNSVVGAVPGAMPPVIGWAAATGTLSIEPFVVFSIMFLWQIPHALAIAVMYREDFARADIKLLPVEDPGGASTGRQVISYCMALIPAGMAPALIGMAGPVYFAISTILGFVYLGYGIHMAREKGVASARRLFYYSLIYLPALLLAMIFG